MSAKINSVRSALLFFALALVISGCTPAGPRALLRGKKDLDSGNYAGAVAQFKTATELLSTNAAAWNYYGVALQSAGQLDDAVNAYRRALELNRDLVEAHLNLGTLFLDQNNPDAAKTEFTAYALRRPNDPAGWLRLGSAQLKLGETVAAERSFSAAYHLDTNNVEALNGFGLARIQRNKPEEAARFFAAAVLLRPDFAAALLNLAAVNQEYLHNNQAALENYRAYLALTPRPANWDEVNAVAEALEKNPASNASAPPAPAAAAPVARPNPPVAAETKPPPRTYTVASIRHIESPRARSGEKPMTVKPPERPDAAAPAQVVRVAPEPQIVTTPGAAGGMPVGTPISEPVPKPALWQRLFGSPTSGGSGTAAEAPPVVVKKQAPVVIIPPAPVEFPRYNYLSPRPPAAGDRRAAAGAFTQARLAEQEENWTGALRGYREAAALDPSWFVAQYNAGVIAQRLRDYSAALASYETALAIEPGSVDARYNFALTLKAAGYAPDAEAELKKIIAAHPGEVRAHLALANLCAQSLHDPAQARREYLKVLALDPGNPQTADIRFWLSANPQ
jgi:tetratricopeptide (TPR) repeat protein